MAQFIPPSFDPDRTPPGERRVFRELQNCPGTEDWKIIHSFDVPKHIRQVEGEIDFLVLIPGLGVVCLEVKSHERIARNDHGLWELGNKTEVRGPFKQASEAMHSLREKRLKNLPRGTPMVSAVAFTEVVFDQPAIEWESWQVIDSRNFGGTKLRDALIHVCQKMREKFSQVETAKWFNPGTPEPTHESIREIVRSLRPYFEVFQTPRQRLQAIDSEILEFTEQQFEAIDTMEYNQSVLFVGPAGTGKTLLAMEAVRRAANQGRNVLYLCFNKRLAMHVAKCIGQQPTTVVMTFHAYLEKLTGLSLGSTPRKDYFESSLPNEALRLVSSPEFQKFDVVVIDEFQDLAKDQYVAVIRQLIDRENFDSREFFFGDFDEQAIFGSGKGARQIFRQLAVSTPIVRLTKNCRNRPELDVPLSMQGFTMYSEYLRPNGGKFLYFDESHPDYLNRIVTAIRDLVGRYTSAQVKILVATDSRNPGPNVLKILHALGNSPQLRPEVVAIYEFKGLECRAAILVDIGDISIGQNRRLYYIGVTRATEQLVLSISPELRDAIV